MHLRFDYSKLRSKIWFHIGNVYIFFLCFALINYMVPDLIRHYYVQTQQFQQDLKHNDSKHKKAKHHLKHKKNEVNKNINLSKI